MSLNTDVLNNAKEGVRWLLVYLGEDPDREGLKETPDRVVKAFAEMTTGYRTTKKEIGTLLKTFDAENMDEMIVVKDIEFTSTCEHHMLPFVGVAHVGYIPDGRIVGLSKIGRLVEVFSRRLQVQERLTTEIAYAIMEHVKPRGAAVKLEAKHSCMGCRGVRKPGASMVTCKLLGVFQSDAATRAEFFNHVGGS